MPGASPGRILNNNLFGIALQFASGIPVTLRSSRELNNDAIGADRPLGVTRNSLQPAGALQRRLPLFAPLPVNGNTAAEVMAR